MPDDVSLTFSHVERMIVGGVMPVSKTVELNEVPELNKGPFLARRELGIINVGGPGKVSVDGKATALAAREGLYVPDGHERAVVLVGLAATRRPSSTSPARRRTRATRR